MGRERFAFRGSLNWGIIRPMKRIVFSLIVPLMVALAACEGVEREDLEVTPVDEIPPGPGLFSDESGGYTVVGGGNEALIEVDGISGEPETPSSLEGLPEGLPPDTRNR